VGPDEKAAIAQLADSLESAEIAGVRSNLAFLIAAL